MSAADLSFVESLCWALEHAWNPDALFVIFTAYFDEADTHGPTPTIIMAAYLGHAYQWKRFGIKLGRIQERYDFRIFHGVQFKSRSGEFNGWSDQKCEALIGDLSALVSDTLMEGMAIHLEHARYMQEYRAPPVPKKMRLDSQYGVCFRACMGYISRMLREKGFRDTLHVVMERGHPNVWDCERIFNELKGGIHPEGPRFLGTFTVEKKTDCMPLMVADLLAASYSRVRSNAATGASNPEVYTTQRPRKGAWRFLN